MTRETETESGPIIVEGHGIKIERKWGEARTIIVFGNGMIAAVDELFQRQLTEDQHA